MQVETVGRRTVNEERAVATYRLVLAPDGGLQQALAVESAYATAQYGAALAWSAKPVLELVRFEARKDMEDTLLRWMRRICGQFAAFDLAFNNYGSQPGTALYLRVADGNLLQTLAGNFHLLDGWLKANGMQAVRISAALRLPLVHRLNSEESLPFLLDFSARSLHAVVKVEELILEKSEGQLVSRLPLSPARIQTKE